ncbi:MAG: isoleucine--tRNA ligase [Isosphaeraceae bacterium]|nr:isoleucine--tRNA ligase [Isosphaeraceae bacterium]
MSNPPKAYKDTINLPVTRFDMKANLTAKEPRFQEHWRSIDLYGKIRRARAGAPRKVLHDGPPYANGEIHMGHLLNKVLKDLVVRSLTMSGFDSPYVPGWDCHGLPIEHKVVKDLGPKAATMSPTEIRELCGTEAMKWVGIQRDQFRRLGIEGDWDRPYLTLDKRYEAGILDVLADLVDRGYVFRQLKPIHWDIHDRTALAEAELEYAEVTSPTVFVNFPVVSGLPAALADRGGDWNLMIWTTTPWTLPANVAIAAGAELDYAAVTYRDPADGRTVNTILAAELVAKVFAKRQIVDHEIVARFKGGELDGARYRHVFLDRVGQVVLANYVSADDGTGLVHTAPGHGAEDYQTGQARGLETISPVDESGRFDASAPDWLQGKGVFAANPEIVKRLEADGTLFHHEPIRHQYPHGWRSKKPIIFRATYQWFIGVDRNGLRERTLAAIDGVKWLPAWGRTRIDSMVGGRPDWCISRQRAWGVPIPVLHDPETGYHHLTAESVRFHRDLFREEGAGAWYSRSVAELIPPDLDTKAHPVESLRKGTDILDVWFESGSSHRSVVREPSYDIGPFPAHIYLEGSDQHRGWFQSSILTAVGTTDRAPFETVLTHGFILDDKGLKMSKSGNNAISAVKATEQYGADVLRLYVAGLDYSDDVRMSERGIKETSDAYRKIRNTFRYLLGNLGDYADFDPTTFDVSRLVEIDRWALGRLDDVIRDVARAYERFEFYKVHQRIYQFCSVDLSSFYLDILKDRLYAEKVDGDLRRSAQYVMARLHVDLTKLLAPILPHTCEELWELIPEHLREAESVHLALFPQPDARFDDPALAERWASFSEIRDLVNAAIEPLRKEKQVGSNQEVAAVITAPPGRAEALARDASTLEMVLTLSTLEIVADASLAADAAPRVAVARSPHAKCERCWNLRPSVGRSTLHPTLCDRCESVIEAG